MQDNFGDRPARLGDLRDQPWKVGDRAKEKFGRMPFASAVRIRIAAMRHIIALDHTCGDQHRRIVTGKDQPECQQKRG